MRETFTLPAVGEIWHQQGGIYAGVLPARSGLPSFHMIITMPMGRQRWGYPQLTTQAKSLTDGMFNTNQLIKADEYSPAAVAAHEYCAGGHTDFYLPSVGELWEAWLNLGPRPLGWILSSSEHSPDNAYYVGFDDGCHHHENKEERGTVCFMRKVVFTG